MTDNPMIVSLARLTGQSSNDDALSGHSIRSHRPEWSTNRQQYVQLTTTLNH